MFHSVIIKKVLATSDHDDDFLQIGGSHNSPCIHFKFNPPIPGQVCKLQGHQQLFSPSKNKCHQQPLSPLSPLSTSKSKNKCHQKPKTIVTILSMSMLFTFPHHFSFQPFLCVVIFTNVKSQHRSYKS